MAENIQRSKGRPQGYKIDRGGTPADSGPFVGEIMNNVDPTRSGRIQVWIEDFAGPNKNDKSLWRTLSYVSPFYGSTRQVGTSKGVGTYTGNKDSYGMWFSAPDVGSKVICFFASGDPNQGYYIGCPIEPGINHMLPSTGASSDFNPDNDAQKKYFKNAKQLPVVEINDEDKAIDENPRYYDQKKPVQGVVAATTLQQGLITDTVRGVPGTSSQRESPSNVFGLNSPGRPIYSGGLTEKNIEEQLSKDAVKPQDANIISRRGGHSIALDDGDLKGQDQQICIKTAKGHKIVMSDDGDSFYITHANGQTWVELGKEGTVDVYSSNSINLRSQGDINIHADRNVNINGGKGVNVNGVKNVNIQSEVVKTFGSDMVETTSKYFHVNSNRINLDSDWYRTNTIRSYHYSNWGTGGRFQGRKNSLGQIISTQNMSDVKFQGGSGWGSKGNVQTISTRLPTHEPYYGKSKGVSTTTSLSDGLSGSPSPAISGKMESIKNVQVAPITVGDFAAMPAIKQSVGPLNGQQLTGMMAQMAKQVNQPFNQMSESLGVGKFGFSPQQLETAGFLKPGTYNSFLSQGNNTMEQILNSPSVWTGKGGITNVSSLLSNSDAQTGIQASLYKTTFDALKINGLISGKEDAASIGPLVQTASKFGIDTTKTWLQQGQAGVSLTPGVNFGSLPADASEAVQKAFSQLTGAVTSTATGLVNTGTNLATGAVNTVTNLGTNALKTAENAATAILDQGTALANNAKQLATGAMAQASQIGNKLASLPSDLENQMNAFAKGGQASLAAVQDKISALVQGFSPQSIGAQFTTNRVSVDIAMKEIIGNDKIPTPVYTSSINLNQFGAVGDLFKNAMAKINEAQKLVASTVATAQGAVSGAINMATSAAGAVQSGIASTVGQATSMVNSSIAQIGSAQSIVSTAVSQATSTAQASIASANTFANTSVTSLINNVNIPTA